MKSTDKKRIFFICSHLKSLDEIKIELPENYNECKLSEKLVTIKVGEANKSFKVIVFSLSFYNSNIDGEVVINLNAPKLGVFSGKITFNPNKNNFKYDFSFDILHKEKEDIKIQQNLVYHIMINFAFLKKCSMINIKIGILNYSIV